jgi:hypothetical protein
MPAITLTPVNPLVVDGSTKIRVYTTTSNVADADTASIVEFSQVLEAHFVPLIAGVSPGIVFSGAGNRTLTFKVSTTATGGGRLTVRGF